MSVEHHSCPCSRSRSHKATHAYAHARAQHRTQAVNNHDNLVACHSTIDLSPVMSNGHETTTMIMNADNDDDSTRYDTNLQIAVNTTMQRGREEREGGRGVYMYVGG